MNIKKIGTFISLAVISLIILASCSSKKRLAEGQNIVINEVMASNRTGLLNHKGNPGDWIEIKNTSKDSIDLEGFELALVKPQKPQAAKQKDDSEDNEEDNIKTWEFPSIRIGAGECMVVFAKKDKAKKDNNEEGDEEDSDNDKEYKAGDPLVANFNLPKEGATLQFRAPNGDVITEVNYGQLEPDQSLARKEDGKYEATYWQSPGFDNHREGYEKAAIRMDDQRKDPLRIWEVMSRAGHSYENWVELKNTGNKPLDLSAYKLSKKLDKKEPGWNLPNKTLAPGEIISIQLAGGKAKESNTLQAPFKIGDNETVVLSKGGKFVDGACAKLTPYASSLGRKKGSKGFFFFSSPTRNEENGASGRRFIAEKPEWNQKPGIYKKQNKVSLKPSKPGQVIHYTLDGSEPTLNSPVLKDSIVLTKPTVVRSIAEGDSITMNSNVATASYMIGVDHDLPVINISLNHADMYDHNTGIYANGPGYGGDFPYSNANFWKNWTKKAYVEVFDDKEGFASDCGLKIFGGFSRAEEKKSLRIKFRGEFGDAKVNYDFFGTGKPLDIEDLVLRSGSQDYDHYMIKDEFFTSLAQTGSPSLLIQMYRPVALYVNAEYFGLYYLREKIDKNFVARKLNLPNDSIDVFLSGPSPYKEMVEKISGMDMSKKENYDFAKKNIDLTGLIDYKIGNIFAGKWDAGNIRYARSRHPQSDKKWRFVFYDIDASWSGDKPTARFFLSTSPDVVDENIARHNVLINRLLNNNEFRQLFLERLAYHLANTYATKNTTAHFDKFVDRIRPEMKHNCKRWPKLSYEQWEKNIAEFRSRFDQRPQKILNDLREYLNITDAENKKYFANLGY